MYIRPRGGVKDGHEEDAGPAEALRPAGDGDLLRQLRRGDGRAGEEAGRHHHRGAHDPLPGLLLLHVRVQRDAPHPGGGTAEAFRAEQARAPLHDREVAALRMCKTRSGSVSTRVCYNVIDTLLYFQNS